MFNCFAIAALVKPYLCKSTNTYYPYTPYGPCMGVCLTQGLAVGHCYIKEATPQCHPYTSNDKELLTILLTKIRSIEMN